MIVTEKKLIANRKNALLGGRPKGTIEESTLYKREIKRIIIEKAWEKVAEMTDSMINEAIKGSAVAFVAVMDRAIDKPIQGVEHSGIDGNPIVFMPIELMSKYGIEPHEPINVNQDIIKKDVPQINGSVEPLK